MELSRIPERIRHDPVLGKLWYDVHYNDLNGFLIFTGKPGSRKSGSAGTVGFELDKNFSIGRCKWLGTEVLDLIEKGELINGEYRPLKKGSVILWDETGVDADNTEWYTQKAKTIKHVFTLARYRNLIVLMTTTSVGAVQIGVRRLLHGVFRMHGIPRDPGFDKTKFAQATFYWYHENFTDGKPRFVIPRYQYFKGDYSRLDRYFIPRPPADWENEYKRLKDYYAKNWVRLFRQELDSLNKRLSVDDGAALQANIDREKVILKDVRENIGRYLVWPAGDGAPKVLQGLIQEDYPGLENKKAKDMVRTLNDLIKGGRVELPKRPSQKTENPVFSAPVPPV